MKSHWTVLLALAALVAASTAVSAIDLKQSPFEQASVQLRYSTVSEWNLQDQPAAAGESADKNEFTPKSPVKAALMSLVVPGLGQYYYGSRVKPWIFLGAEVAAWTMYFKWHGDYNDMTDEFEAFQQANWQRARYEDYLWKAYGERSDVDIDSVEISHNLPDTYTGQYYEMTGKYDQFSWGWVDAVDRFGNTLDHYSDDSAAWYDSIAVRPGHPAPTSAKRNTYLKMREDTNKKYDQAQAMILVSVANHLISSIEAYLTTKSRNKAAQSTGDEFSQFSVRASLKSYNSWQDTPCLVATYRF